jgi:hypothetical protein
VAKKGESCGLGWSKANEVVERGARRDSDALSVHERKERKKQCVTVKETHA